MLSTRWLPVTLSTRRETNGRNIETLMKNTRNDRSLAL